MVHAAHLRFCKKHHTQLVKLFDRFGRLEARPGGDGIVMRQHVICRELFTEIMAEVRRHFIHAQIHNAWVRSGDRKHWEFHGPNGEFFDGLRMADCAWSAKAAGWTQLLEQKAIVEDANIDPRGVLAVARANMRRTKKVVTGG